MSSTRDTPLPIVRPPKLVLHMEMDKHDWIIVLAALTHYTSNVYNTKGRNERTKQIRAVITQSLRES